MACGEDELITTIVLRWCTNEAQPLLETLVEIAKILKIDVKDLLVSRKNKLYNVDR